VRIDWTTSPMRAPSPRSATAFLPVGCFPRFFAISSAPPPTMTRKLTMHITRTGSAPRMARPSCHGPKPNMIVSIVAMHVTPRSIACRLPDVRVSMSVTF